jgi:hypothetical protein
LYSYFSDENQKDQVIWPSYKVHIVDALAVAVDEGRGKLR